jgi:hypothetical protein
MGRVKQFKDEPVWLNLDNKKALVGVLEPDLTRLLEHSVGDLQPR